MADTEELEKKIEFKESHSTPEIKESIFFYGVGNHGGGPTKRNIQTIYDIQKVYPEKLLKFSNFEDFFEAIKAKNYDLPTRNGEFFEFAKGCYSAISEIKQNIRRSEEGLIAAEKYAVMAHALIGKKMPEPQEFEKAWKNVLFMHFHDVSCGTGLRQIYKDFRNIAGSALYFAEREENSAQQALSWKIDTSDATKGTPVVVFNPHSFTVTEPVTVNLQCNCVTDNNGNIIPSQRIWSPKRHNLGRGDDTLFVATVGPLGYNTYYFKENEVGVKHNTDVSGEEFRIENEYLRVEFDRWSGGISSVFDKKQERELLSGKGALAQVMNDTDSNTWGHGKLRFNELIGQFCDPKFTLLENGPVRATIRVESFYGNSKLTQYFSLSAGSKKLQVKVALDWHEKFKALKLRFPVNTENASVVCDVPYGVAKRVPEGIERPMQKWVAIDGSKGGIAVLNDSKYSYSAEDNVLYITVLRSPIYNDQGRHRTDPDAEISDQGLQEFGYSLMPYYENHGEINRHALVLNKGLTNVIENNHNGILPESQSTISVSEDNVIVTAMKRAEDNKGFVIRLTETVGRDTVVTVSGKAIAKLLDITLTKWSTDTYMLRDGESEWKKVLLTEFDID